MKKRIGLTLFLSMICIDSNNGLLEIDSPFSIVRNSPVFVDKTMLIKTFVESLQRYPCALVTFPRGFGKSVNIDMIKRFLELPLTDDIKEANDLLFRKSDSNLMVTKDKAFYDEYYAKYPMIFLSFHVGSELTDAYQILDALKNNIIKCFEPYDWIFRETNITNVTAHLYPESHEKEVYERLVKRQGNEEEWLESVGMLAENVARFYEKGVMLLVDDYDEAITVSLQLGVQAGIFPFVYAVTESIFRVFPRCISYVLLLGTLPITVLDIPEQHHFLQENNTFQKYFGFTQKEMLNVYTSPKITPKIEPEEIFKVEKYYKAYRAKDRIMKYYNPLSIKNYFTGSRPELINYWGRADIIVNFFTCFENQNIRNQVEELVLSGIARFKLMINFSPEDLIRLEKMMSPNAHCHHSKRYDAELYFSLLFHFGYLMYTGEYEDEFAIPNRDVKLGFSREIEDFFSDIAKIDHATLIANFKGIADGGDFKPKEITEKLNDVLSNMFTGICNSSLPGFGPYSTLNDFHVLLFSVLDLRQEGNFATIQAEEFVNSLHKNGSVIPRGGRVDIFILSLNMDGVVFVEMKYGVALRRIVTQLEKYRPSAEHAKLANVTRTVAIQVKKDCNVLVEFCHVLKRDKDRMWIIET